MKKTNIIHFIVLLSSIYLIICLSSCSSSKDVTMDFSLNKDDAVIVTFKNGDIDDNGVELDAYFAGYKDLNLENSQSAENNVIALVPDTEHKILVRIIKRVQKHEKIPQSFWDKLWNKPVKYNTYMVVSSDKIVELDIPALDGGDYYVRAIDSDYVNMYADTFLNLVPCASNNENTRNFFNFVEH